MSQSHERFRLIKNSETPPGSSTGSDTTAGSLFSASATAWSDTTVHQENCRLEAGAVDDI